MLIMDPISKRQLLDRLTASRVMIGRDALHLRAEWDVPHKAMTAVRSNPIKWLGGAALSGFLFAKLRGRPKPAKAFKSRGGKEDATTPVKEVGRLGGIVAALIGLFRLCSPVLRPLIMSYATKALTKYATRI